MPFEHRIIQDDEDVSLLDCDNVEALAGLEILAEQLREDARYLAERYPVETPGGIGRQAIVGGLASSLDANRTSVDRQRERCLSRVNELLATRQRSSRVAWLKRLVGGGAVAAVCMICAAIAWRVSLPQAGGGNLRENAAGITSIAGEYSDQARMHARSNRAGLHPGSLRNEPSFASHTALTQPLAPTPVVFEMPAVFRSASEPEMEALLDLYDTETAGRVTIGF